MAEDEEKEIELATLKQASSVSYGNHWILNSKRWEGLPIRKDDIFVCTSYKSGTTWTQAIIANLLFQDEEKFPQPVLELSPWIGAEMCPVEQLHQLVEQQKFRRFLKAHLPADAIPLYKEPKYLCIFRDPRDVFMSILNHWTTFTEEAVGIFNSREEGIFQLPIPPPPVSQAFRGWLQKNACPNERDGYPFWSSFRHAQTWWEIRDWPNILFVHYNDLKKDIRGQMKEIADFLGIEVKEEVLDQLVKNVHIDNMRKKGDLYLGKGAQLFQEGAKSFLYKGTNGRWVDELTQEDLALYDQMKGNYPAEMIQWLETGGPAPPKE